MIILMADSASPQNVPGTFTAVAVYINGLYAWPQAKIDRFPRILRISVLSDPSHAAAARVLDVERCDASPGRADFIRERQRLGHHDATIYCGESVVPAVQSACAGLSYRLWVASWTGHPHEIDNAWAVQYSGGVNLQYDTSIVYGREDFSRP